MNTNQPRAYTQPPLLLGSCTQGRYPLDLIILGPGTRQPGAAAVPQSLHNRSDKPGLNPPRLPRSFLPAETTIKGRTHRSFLSLSLMTRPRVSPVTPITSCASFSWQLAVGICLFNSIVPLTFDLKFPVNMPQRKEHAASLLSL